MAISDTYLERLRSQNNFDAQIAWIRGIMIDLILKGYHYGDLVIVIRNRSTPMTLDIIIKAGAIKVVEFSREQAESIADFLIRELLIGPRRWSNAPRLESEFTS